MFFISIRLSERYLREAAAPAKIRIIFNNQNCFAPRFVFIKFAQLYLATIINFCSVLARKAIT